jgi:hypothetical protein
VHRGLVDQAELDQPRDGANAQAVLAREGQQALSGSQRAVVVQHIGQHRGGLEAREAREVTAALGVAGALEHPAWLGAQWKHMPGLYQVARLRAARHGGTYRMRAVGGGNAGTDAFGRLYGDREPAGVDAVRSALDHQVAGATARSVRP